MSWRYVTPLSEQLRHLKSRVPKRKKVSPVTRPDVDAESFGMKLAEHVAGFLGTWRFIGALSIFIVGWMLWNVLAPEPARFDPWPFMGDNLFMSMMAALTGPILLIAAAAGAARDHRQAQRIEQLAWDIDKQGSEIKDAQGAQDQKLDTLTENLADLHAAFADLATRINEQPATGSIVRGMLVPGLIVGGSTSDLQAKTEPKPKRSHHKQKVTVTP